MSSWDQSNRGGKLGLVWRKRKKISQMINDYLYLPFFLLIISCYILEPHIASQLYLSLAYRIVHKLPIDHSYRLLFHTPRLLLLGRPGPPYLPCLPCLLATHHPSPRLSETSTIWATQHLPHLLSPTPPTQPWLPLSPMPATCPILATCLTEGHLTALMETMAIPAMVTSIPASAMATHPKVGIHCFS
jgi:hypothetical protein